MSENSSDEFLLSELVVHRAAQRVGMTFHHLVREELNAIEPGRLRLDDQYERTMSYRSIDEIESSGDAGEDLPSETPLQTNL